MEDGQLRLGGLLRRQQQLRQHVLLPIADLEQFQCHLLGGFQAVAVHDAAFDLLGLEGMGKSVAVHKRMQRRL